MFIRACTHLLFTHLSGHSSTSFIIFIIFIFIIFIIFIFKDFILLLRDFSKATTAPALQLSPAGDMSLGLTPVLVAAQYGQIKAAGV